MCFLRCTLINWLHCGKGKRKASIIYSACLWYTRTVSLSNLYFGLNINGCKSCVGALLDSWRYYSLGGLQMFWTQQSTNQLCSSWLWLNMFVLFWIKRVLNKQTKLRKKGKRTRGVVFKRISSAVNKKKKKKRLLETPLSVNWPQQFTTLCTLYSLQLS